MPLKKQKTKCDRHYLFHSLRRFIGARRLGIPGSLALVDGCPTTRRTRKHLHVTLEVLKALLEPCEVLYHLLVMRSLNVEFTQQQLTRLIHLLTDQNYTKHSI